MVDALASEYGWKAEYAMSLPVDQIAQLMHAILYRKGMNVRLKKAELSVPKGTLAQRLESVWASIDTED